VVAHETEDRHVELRFETPGLVPLRLLEKGWFVEFAATPGIQYGLQAAREHLHAHTESGGVAVEGGECLQLPPMVGRVIVVLAE